MRLTKQVSITVTPNFEQQFKEIRQSKSNDPYLTVNAQTAATSDTPFVSKVIIVKLHRSLLGDSG